MNSRDFVLSRFRELGQSDALSLKERTPDMTDTEIIDEEDKIPDWDGTKDYTGYPVGFAVAYDIASERNIFGLIQPHNAANYPDANPDNTRALWGLKHTKNPAKARSFVAPQGTSGMYMKDECYRGGDTVYVCLNDNTVYTAVEYPQGWKVAE